MEQLVEQFKKTVREEREVPLPVASISMLTQLIKQSSASTMTQLTMEIEQATRVLAKETSNSIPVTAGCELFLRLLARTALDVTDFDHCKQRLIERGEGFLQTAIQSKHKIAMLGSRFIRDGAVILTHSYSRLVMGVLLQAAKENRRFKVYVTESRNAKSGYWTVKALEQAGIPVVLILDSAVGYIMEKIDLVLVGAEGVVENGGIINQIGTYQMAIVAKAANKPFYVAVESYKFVRFFPLNQYDLPPRVTSTLNLMFDDKDPPHDPIPSKAEFLNQSIDYTPPTYITLLFSDLGVLTPSAVSDELIKLYY